MLCGTRRQAGLAAAGDALQGQLSQEPFLNFLTQVYGSNTTHCLGGRSQRFLLATQGTSVRCEIHQSINRMKIYFLNLMVSYFCSSNNNR
jgi:hypothetical protein